MIYNPSIPESLNFLSDKQRNAEIGKGVTMLPLDDLKRVQGRVYLILFLTVGQFFLPLGLAKSNDTDSLLQFMRGVTDDPHGTMTNSWNQGYVDELGCPSHWYGVFCSNGTVHSLVLENLGLSGVMKPGTLGRLSGLTYLSLANNFFAGTIPEDFGNLSSLKELHLHNNCLNGSIPVSMGALYNLANFSLAENELSGPIPEVFGNMSFLVDLDLSGNNFFGSIPSTLTQLQQLYALNLSHNYLSNSSSFKLDMLQQLEILDLHQNKFSGDIHPEWMNFNKLQKLDLSANQFSGLLPWRQAGPVFSNLLHLNLSHNMLSGILAEKYSPSLFANSLQILDLSSNDISGELPSFNFAYSLKILRLNNNFLAGSIPFFLLSDQGNLLEELDLSSNNLSGSVDEILAANLKILNLSDNIFFGAIPTKLGSNCSILDLSNNQFSGNLSALGNWESTLEVLDLSNNLFTGALPNITVELMELLYLNLSHNRLSGVLSPDLRSLTSLQYLDISFNQLSGPIPPLMPSSLDEFNVSYNVLSGLVPQDLACKFPHSTYFPGNPHLQIGTGSGCHVSQQSFRKGPKGPAIIWKKEKRRMNLMFKAGLVAGCTAAAFISLFSLLLIYYKRISCTFPEIPHMPEFYASGHKGKSTHPREANFINQAHRGVGYPISSSSYPLDHLGIHGNYKDFHNARNEDESYILDDASCELVEPLRLKSFKLSPSKSHKENLPPMLEQPSADFEGQVQERLSGDLIIFDNTMTLTLEELFRAPAEVVGVSCHGTTFKAILFSGHMLGVKWLNTGFVNCRKEFVNTAKMIGSFKHPNILPVRGCYWGPGEHEKLLLSDFVSAGNLASHLSEGTDESSPLTWSQRICVAVDIASGLTYLHVEHQLPHGNLKSTNVLLDGPEFDTKLTDYGLHRFLTSEGTRNQLLNAGALGYLAPEIAGANKAKPTLSADVYAFGVILMELLTGKSAGDIILGSSGVLDLPDWVNMFKAEGRHSKCFDHSLCSHERDQELPKGIHKVLAIALRCVSPCSARPNMKTVYEDLVAVIPN